MNDFHPTHLDGEELHDGFVLIFLFRAEARAEGKHRIFKKRTLKTEGNK